MTTAKGSKRTSTKPKLWSNYTSVRKGCRACGGELETVLDLGVQEIISLGDKEKRSAPLELTKCARCSLVQLRHTVDREYLFRSYYYRSGATQTMKDHLKGVVEDVMKRVDLKDDDIVVDIGSNDSTLLNCYPPRFFGVGFEPSELWAEFPIPNGVIMGGFFSAEAYFLNRKRRKLGLSQRAKVITAIAMFYDLDDPNAFLQDVKKVLAPDGLFVLQVNLLDATLMNNAVGDIVHEHLCYYSVSTMTQLLHKNGLSWEDLSYNSINGGSVRFYIRHKTEDESSAGHIYQEVADWNAEIKAFADRISTIVRKTREYVETLRKMGKTVSVVGASTRGATFLQYAGLAPRYGIFVDCVERDPSKVGKRYLGLSIVSEEADADNPSDWYLMTTPWLKDEMLKRMPHARKWIVPLPVPKVITNGIEVAL